MKAPAVLTAALEEAVNRYLSLDPDSPARLAELRDGVVALHLSGLDVELFFVPGADRVQVLGRFDGVPDTRISGSPLSLTRLSFEDAVTGLPEGVEVEGDARLGQQFRELVRGVDIDWEELLSRVTGDLVAHQVGEAVRGLWAWTRRAEGSLKADVSEYLREEIRAVPVRSELESFMDAVDTFRSDVDRLEARVRRLERTLDSPSDEGS